MNLPGLILNKTELYFKILYMSLDFAFIINQYSKILVLQCQGNPKLFQLRHVIILMTMKRDNSTLLWTNDELVLVAYTREFD